MVMLNLEPSLFTAYPEPIYSISVLQLCTKYSVCTSKEWFVLLGRFDLKSRQDCGGIHSEQQLQRHRLQNRVLHVCISGRRCQEMSLESK